MLSTASPMTFPVSQFFQECVGKEFSMCVVPHVPGSSASGFQFNRASKLISSQHLVWLKEMWTHHFIIKKTSLCISMFCSCYFPNGKLQINKIGNLKKKLEAIPLCLRLVFLLSSCGGEAEGGSFFSATWALSCSLILPRGMDLRCHLILINTVLARDKGYLAGCLNID